MLSDQKLVELWVHSICGGLGGALSTACSYPFTNIRLRRIAEDLKKAQIDEKPLIDTREKKFWSEKIEIVHFTKELINKNGIMTLYNGMTSSIVGSAVQYAIYFCSSKFFGYSIDYLGLELGNLSRTMLINLISAICTALITNPIWVVNVRMAKREQDESKISNIDMIKLIYEQEGLSGFFKGITPSLILTLVPVMQFTLYELLKKSFVDNEGKLSNKNLFLISSLSKVLTIITSYPLMTAKALYQSNSKLPSNEVWKLILKLIKEEGLFGFYKGFGPKILGAVLNNIILMFTYERMQNLVRLILSRIIFGKKRLIQI